MQAGVPGGRTPLRSEFTAVRLHGQRLRLHHVATSGNPEPPDLVLLHGMASSWRQWRATMDRLGGEASIVAPDFPGFGRSGSTRRPLTAPDFADAMEAWCRAHRWPALAVVGHSFGGAVLIDWAARHPGRFRSLGLLAPAALWHPWFSAGPGVWRWPALGPIVLPAALWLMSTRRLGPRYFGHIVTDLPALLASEELADLQWGCRRSREMLRALDYYRFGDVPAQLRRILQPAQVGWGTADRVVPYEDAAVYTSGLADCRLTTWEGCGHVPMVERRRECDDFLRAVAAAGRRKPSALGGGGAGRGGRPVGEAGR